MYASDCLGLDVDTCECEDDTEDAPPEPTVEDDAYELKERNGMRLVLPTELLGEVAFRVDESHESSSTSTINLSFDSADD